MTEEGKKIQQEHDELENEFYSKIINSLDTYEERENFISLIDKIANNISRK